MIDHRTTPPRQAERFVAWLLADRRWREVTLGDLAEEFEDRLRRGTPARARAWYWSQALALIPARLIDPLRSFFAPTGDSLARSVVTEVRLACRALMHQPLLTSLVVVT